MTNWEQWLASQKSRKDIICSVYDHSGTGRCGMDCILYGVCCKEFNPGEREEATDAFLDSEAVPTRNAVIINLGKIREEAAQLGYGGYVKTLTRAIELLQEGEK